MTNQNNGCGLTGCLILFAVCLALSAMLVWGFGYAAEGEATIIRAQGQARLDTALANTITMASVMPLVVFGSILIVVLAVLGATTLVLIKALETRPRTVPQIVQREIYYLPSPNVPRREIWRQLADDNREVLVIPAKSEVMK